MVSAVSCQAVIHSFIAAPMVRHWPANPQPFRLHDGQLDPPPHLVQRPLRQLFGLTLHVRIFQLDSTHGRHAFCTWACPPCTLCHTRPQSLSTPETTAASITPSQDDEANVFVWLKASTDFVPPAASKPFVCCLGQTRTALALKLKPFRALQCFATWLPRTRRYCCWGCGSWHEYVMWGARTME